MKRTRHRASIERALARRRPFRFSDYNVQLYYHRDGTPYTGTLHEQVLEWGRDLEHDRPVAYTRFEDGSRLSTRWFGLDSGMPALFFGSRRRAPKPLTFETMFFAEGDELDQYRVRYATEADARAGHQAIVAELVARGRVRLADDVQLVEG